MRYLFASFVLLVTGCIAGGADDSTEVSSRKEGSYLNFNGKYEAVSLTGYTKFNNTKLLIQLKDSEIDQEVMQLSVDIAENGEGKLESQTRCKEVLTRVNPAVELQKRLLIESGLVHGASFTSTSDDLKICERYFNEDKDLVTSQLKIAPLKEPNGDTARKLPANSGFFKVNPGASSAQNACNNLINMKLIKLDVGSDSHQNGAACLGFSDKTMKKLKLIVIPSLSEHAIMADYQKIE